ncbi:hypothetical protein COU57_07000 [Candidatus Pacearchaeota archaeon CG10_big_fil_rev_8_21_14_0_10_32_14]|nr:MAG: hypothetical protein COU57_07000 [Candidatus Pacearchaeota archaeon CG10_big_fil_rev_8_21_14_0_10_32_14]
MKGKRGLSTVVTVLLFVMLTVVAVVIVYGVVSSLINKNIDDTKKCGPDTLNKLTLNKRYTCFFNETELDGGVRLLHDCTIDCEPPPGYIGSCKNVGSGDSQCYKTKGYQYVSINVGDIEIEKVIVGLSDGLDSKAYEIVAGANPATSSVYNYGVGPTDYDGVESGPPSELKLAKKQGKTYVIRYDALPTVNYKPSKVVISPVIGGKTCGTGDQVLEIPSCDPAFGFPVNY